MPDKEDRRWLLLTALIILSVTSIPYLLGYFRQGTDWHFTGFVFGVEDGNSYIAKMLSGSFGNWLFRSPYSAMPQSGVLAFLPYLLLGKLAYPPEIHDQLVGLFQAFRWISGGLLIWAVYQYCGLFLSDKVFKKLAALVILLGGGLGWLGWMLLPEQWTGRLPLELYSPEAFGFLSILGLPHLAAARAFLLFGLVFFLKDHASDQWLRPAISGGLCWFAVGFFQPLTIAVGYGILVCYLLLLFLTGGEHRWQNLVLPLKKAAVLTGISLPWVIYNLASFSGDVYLKAWYARNIISSPPLQDYFWSYGLFFAASIPAIIRVVREKKPQELILPAWILCAALLAYFPYNVQRRLIDGVWIALVILIFNSLAMLQKNTWRKLYGILMVSTVVPMALMLFVVTQGAWNPALPVYRPASEISMFTAMSEFIKPGDIVLCSYQTANAIPAWNPVYVLAGHGPESAHLPVVLEEVRSFYSGEKDVLWQKEFIERNSIDFILSGPTEKTPGSWDTRYSKVYQKVYDRGDYQVFTTERADEE